jgi:hypothetical protein
VRSAELHDHGVVRNPTRGVLHAPFVTLTIQPHSANFAQDNDQETKERGFMNFAHRALAFVSLVAMTGTAFAIPVSYTFSGTVAGLDLKGHLTIDNQGVSDGFWTRYSGNSGPSGMVIHYGGQTAVFDEVLLQIADNKPFGILGDRIADGVSFQAFNALLDHSFSASFLDVEADAISNELLLPDFRTFNGGFCAQAEEGCSLSLFGQLTANFFNWAFTASPDVIPISEPGPLSLLGIGLVGLGLLRRRPAGARCWMMLDDPGGRYFPIQKLAKILPSRSWELKSPVISASAC